MPQTPSRPRRQTRPAHHNLFRLEPSPEGSPISSSSPVTPKFASQSPLAPRDFQAEIPLWSQFRGFMGGGGGRVKAGVVAGPPQVSHTLQNRGKAELRNPSQRDSVSSKARSVKPAPWLGGIGALPVIHCRDGGEQPSRPPGSQPLMGNAALRPSPKPLPASNPGKTWSKTSATHREPAVMMEKNTTLKLDSLSTSLTCYSCSLR